MADSFVVARGLVKRFAGRAADVPAMDGVDVDIRPGRVTGLVGPDGAGKTTLIRLIAGLLSPDAGNVTVLGHDTIADPEDVRAVLGYMPQRFGLYEDLSVAENLNLHADLQDLPHDERAETFERLLAFTGLAPFTTRLAGRLSGGMKQKLGLACVLIRRPRVLLLDEPTVGVDPVSRRDLWAMVEDLVDDGIAVLWSTGYLDEAERCGEVLLLDSGKVLYDGPPADLTGRVAGRTWLVRNIDDRRRNVQRRANRLPSVVDSLIQGTAVRLVLREGDDAPTPDDLGAPDARVEPAPPRLEDAFVTLLSAERRIAAAGELSSHDTGTDGGGPVIEVCNLTKRFGEFVAANDVSFEVARGEVFGLLGPNGAGKSTTFRMLCGLLPPTSGTARVTGIDLGRAAPKARARIGYVAQKFSLYGHLTGRQNIAFFGGAYGLGRTALQRATERVADGLTLDDFLDETVEDLPMGIKQRLALACAILHDPAILFLDEPTSGVDPLTRREFWRNINGLADSGVTVMVTTHFLEEAEYCDRVALMYNGRLIALGSPQSLKDAQATQDRPEPTLEDAFIAFIDEQAGAGAASGAAA